MISIPMTCRFTVVPKDLKEKSTQQLFQLFFGSTTEVG
jgi:hypothetical protein